MKPSFLVLPPSPLENLGLSPRRLRTCCRDLRRRLSRPPPSWKQKLKEVEDLQTSCRRLKEAEHAEQLSKLEDEQAQEMQNTMAEFEEEKACLLEEIAFLEMSG